MPLVTSEGCEGEFLPLPSMGTPRSMPATLVLSDGTVLVTGGYADESKTTLLNSVERFDPVRAVWMPSSPMTTPRAGHHMVQLPDGRVLAVGGFSEGPGSGKRLASAELLDPVTGFWRPTISLSTGRDLEQLLVLPNGRALALGWAPPPYSPEVGEVFDPLTETWIDAGIPTEVGVRALALPDGRVLIHGGNTWRWYDPGSRTVQNVTPAVNLGEGAWTGLLGDGSLLSVRDTYALRWDAATGAYRQTSRPDGLDSSPRGVALRGGSVFFLGYENAWPSPPTPVARRYDPLEERWTRLPLPSDFPGGEMVALHDGTVLFLSERHGGSAPTVWRYVPGADACPGACGPGWRQTAPMAERRDDAIFHALPDGRLLVAGGSNGIGRLTSVELYDPLSAAWSAGPPMHRHRARAASVLLPDGRLFVAGGDVTGRAVELFAPSTGAWSELLPMPERLRPGAALVVMGGDVFTLGSGDDASTRWLMKWSASNGQWSTTPLSTPWNRLAALPDGTLLLFGWSETVSLESIPYADAVRYDPGTQAWLPASNTAGARVHATTTTLRDGRLLVVEGWWVGRQDGAVYDAENDQWTRTGTLSEPRSYDYARVAQLDDDAVLLVGGYDCDSRFEPQPAEAAMLDPVTLAWRIVPGPRDTRWWGSSLAPLPGGRAIVVGGRDPLGYTLKTAEIFVPDVCAP